MQLHLVKLYRCFQCVHWRGLAPAVADAGLTRPDTAYL